MAKLKLDLDSTGVGLLEVDGVDMSKLVAGLSIIVTPGDDVIVRIELVPVALVAEGDFEDVEFGDNGAGS
jgi:hypothetical protein